MTPSAAPSGDELHRQLLEAGEDVERIRGLLSRPDLDDSLLLSVLRRALPQRVLELLAQTRPWCDRTRLQGAIALNSGCSRAVAQQLLPGLLWSDLATLATRPGTPGPIRVRAEAMLQERLPEMGLGERMSLARRAPALVLRPLLQDRDRQVTRAALLNPRLREDDLLAALRDPAVSTALLTEVPVSFRWRSNYAVRRALVRQPRTPLPVALSQLTSLLPADLHQLARAGGVHPLLRAAARRVAEAGGRQRGPAI